MIITAIIPVAGFLETRNAVIEKRDNGLTYLLNKF